MSTGSRRSCQLPGLCSWTVLVKTLGILVAACGRLLSHIALKAAWVHELPFSIWKVVDPESASAFLAQYDQAVAEGCQLHRVARRFGEHGGEFRHDMELFANGVELTERRRVEILSCQIVKLDDT